MTLKELKSKCQEEGWEIKKLSEKPARMYRVKYKTDKSKHPNKYLYVTYVRRKCSICKKEVMKNVDSYRNKNVKPVTGQCMFGKPQRSFCSDECRTIGISGKNHYMYSQTRVYQRNADGYIVMKRYDHPYKNKSNNVQRGRLVVEKDIGRYLKPRINNKPGSGELVHHINMCKQDDSLENLLLCSDASHHLKIHGTYNTICKELMSRNIVRFDKEKGYYLTH